jgi:hypothetical protein
VPVGRPREFRLDAFLAREGFRNDATGSLLETYCQWAETDPKLRARLVQIAQDPALDRDMRMSAAGVLVHVRDKEAMLEIGRGVSAWIYEPATEHDQVWAYLSAKLPLGVLQSDLPSHQMLKLLRALRPDDWMAGIRLWASDETYERYGEDAVFSEEEVRRRRDNAKALLRYIESVGPQVSAIERLADPDLAVMPDGLHNHV